MTPVHIFVASPSDVICERQRLDRAVGSRPVPCRRQPRLGRATALLSQGEQV
jgi:hypothetical protein